MDVTTKIVKHWFYLHHISVTDNLNSLWSHWHHHV